MWESTGYCRVANIIWRSEKSKRIAKHQIILLWQDGGSFFVERAIKSDGIGCSNVK